MIEFPFFPLQFFRTLFVIIYVQNQWPIFQTPPVLVAAAFQPAPDPVLTCASLPFFAPDPILSDPFLFYGLLQKYRSCPEHSAEADTAARAFLHQKAYFRFGYHRGFERQL